MKIRLSFTQEERRIIYIRALNDIEARGGSWYSNHSFRERHIRKM